MVAAMSQALAQTPLTVLLVEDDRDLREALTFALGLEGMAVRGYPDAETVLAEPALPAGAVLVLDEKLPGLGGLALLETLRQRGVGLPAVMITTPTPQVLARARALNAPVIEKPLLTDDLAGRLREMVGAVR